MYTREQIETRKRIDNKLDEDEELLLPNVLFAIRNNKSIIAGIKDSAFEKCTYYLFEILANNKVVKTRLKVQSEIEDDESEMLNRIEGCFLRYLGLDFEIVYINLNYHFYMWDFFDEFINELDYFEEGMHKYLAYAKQVGITHELIDAHCNALYENIYKLFPLNNRFNGIEYSHILKQKIDDKEVCLSYIGSLKDTNDFRVTFIFDDKVAEMADFDNIEDAAKLYMKVYKQMVEDGESTANHVISYMSDFIKEVRRHGDLLP